LKVQMFPVRVAPAIHVIAVVVLPTILQEVYEHGLVVESVKYYLVSKLTDVGFAEPGY